MVIFLLTLFLLISFLCKGQVRTITGKIVDEFEFEPIPEVRIHNGDTVRLGTTDRNGNFEIELLSGVDELLLSFIGMEWTLIKVPANCNDLEIIMIADGTYDFMTIRKVNRKRYRIFKDLNNKHLQAYEKGIFTSNAPCFTYIFHKYLNNNGFHQQQQD
ncbi:hypothetical protein E1163_04990 [Fulvivirga kasyanovii]|uniref:Carboxypeptidase-like regulatory domain-containing protein n=2 Tax=Fulvivirga kasyanovii TaxID=396812 RepID=A0ABW9RK36_9BACT|nr:hypothetical protein [Fulvivirga kasyanovii]